LKKIKIQLIGSFIYYKVVVLDAIELEYFSAIAKRMNCTLEMALIDPFFYYNLKLSKYQSYNDLNGKVFFGLDVNAFHQIEVFVDGHKKQKFSYFDLNPNNLLFPLYPSKLDFPILSMNEIIIRSKEKGSVNYVFTIAEEKLLEELVLFGFSKIENNLLFSNVKFESIEVPIKRTDTVVIEQIVIINK
jgi:hypothetical protein